MVLTSSSKFQLYLYKTKKSNKKFLLDSNILVSLEADQENCLCNIQCLQCFPASQEDKYKDEKKHYHVNMTILSILPTCKNFYITEFMTKFVMSQFIAYALYLYTIIQLIVF